MQFHLEFQLVSITNTDSGLKQIDSVIVLATTVTLKVKNDPENGPSAPFL